MNADRLLALYENVAEAPDAVSRLRRLVLDLAVRGKLVEQDPGDEPASELLKRIAAEKARLEEAGRARRSKDVEPQSTDTPFALPENWAWTNLQRLARARMGKTILSKELTDSGLPVFSAGMENRPWGYIEASDVVFSRGTIVISARGGIGYPKLPDFDQFVSTQTTIACECFDSMVAPYLCLVLEVLPDWPGMKSQTAIPMITVKQVHGIPIPLPPLAEQRRIVAKVEELMALLDRLEAARTAREATRDRLTAASLARLTAPDIDHADFPANARFALEMLPALTTRPDQIKPLRQTILNLAVRGKLVEQDPTDEPVSVSLAAISAKRDDMVKKKELRREKPLNSVREDDAPFEIPSTWQWVRVGELALFTQYGTSAKAAPLETGIPVFTMGNIQEGAVVRTNEKRIPETSKELPGLFLKDLDLLYNRTNSAELVGKTGIYRGDDDSFTFASYLIRIRLSADETSPIYVNLAMNAPDFRETQIVPHIKKQTGQANVSGSTLKNMLIPLPPFAEQHRIVAKVDALMALCDRLEAALTTTDTTRAHLLEALLHKALAPAAEAVTEAAE